MRILHSILLGLSLGPVPVWAADPPPAIDAVLISQTRPLLPSHAWPLTLGREEARRIVDDILEGRERVTISADELVYYGGGIVARPRDMLHTSITINWRMIHAELAAAAQAEAVALTPEQAVQSFKQNPKQPVTVEFGVESAGWLDGPSRDVDDPSPPILADWDGRLKNGGKFSLHLTPKAIRGLKDIGIDLPASQPAGFVDTQRLSVLCKQLKGKGIRVTGLVKASRPMERHTDYVIIVDDPAHFRVNK